MVPSRFRQAVAAHEKSVADLAAATAEVRQALSEWASLAGTQAIAEELGFTRVFVYQLINGTRAWGKFHWKDKHET